MASEAAAVEQNRACPVVQVVVVQQVEPAVLEQVGKAATEELETMSRLVLVAVAAAVVVPMA
jgi:hypothetical protein